jgi:hypothetical protein
MAPIFIEMLDPFRLLNMWTNSISNTICGDYGSGTFISLVSWPPILGENIHFAHFTTAEER